MWIFDMADGGARLLRQRSGHSEPPIKLRFHGNDGKMLLSAGTRGILLCALHPLKNGAGGILYLGLSVSECVSESVRPVKLASTNLKKTVMGI